MGRHDNCSHPKTQRAREKCRREDDEYRAKRYKSNNARQRHLTATDKEWREKKNRKQREYKRQWHLRDPGLRGRENERLRKYKQERLANDPEYRAHFLKRQRERKRYKWVNDRERRKQANRESSWRRNGSNATPDKFDYYYQEQGGHCVLCHRAFENTPHFDHCHDCGDARGLLCNGCNRALGYYEYYDEERLLHAWDHEEVEEYLARCSCYG